MHPPRRLLLKLSGEALMGDAPSGIQPAAVARVCEELRAVQALGVQLALVVGAGNLFRGATATGMDRVRADHIGMLATMMNGLALGERLARDGVAVRVMSAVAVGGLVEGYSRDQARATLDAGGALVFVGGTGNPLFTTDTAAALRAVEIGADLLVKATKVDGIYDDDPVRNPSARRFSHLSYDECLSRQLGVMDAAAFALCRDNAMPIRVCNVHESGSLSRVARGEPVGTLVDRETGA